MSSDTLEQGMRTLLVKKCGSENYIIFEQKCPVTFASMKKKAVEPNLSTGNNY